MKRPTLLALSAAAALPAVGFVGQRRAEQRDRRRFPMPGRLVNVDGVQLHVIVEGSGPTVFFDSGLGGSTGEWEAIAADLRKDFTVVRYDRPGFGWSPASSCDRSPRAAASRIASLLSALDVQTPALLVGHSLGGLHVALAASMFPDLVRGLVLVDPSHIDMYDDSNAAKVALVVARVMQAMAVTAAFGGARIGGRIYGRMALAQLRRDLDPEERQALHGAMLLTACSVGGMRAGVAELIGLPASLRELQHDGIASAHRVPVTLISAAGEPRTSSERTGRESVKALHMNQVESTPFARLVFAENSGHLVPLDEPELVVKCIRETFAAADADDWDTEPVH